MKIHKSVCIFASLLAASLSTMGQGSVTLMHDSFWQITGRDITIQVAHIINSTSEDTGPLFLTLYSQVAAPYDGGAPGRVIARAPLDSISAGQQADNITVTTRLRATPPGLKYTALMIERQNGRRFEIVDWVSYTSTYAFPRRQNGGVGSEDAAIGVGDIAADQMTLTLTGRRATFNIAKIQNQRPVDTTGVLRLAFYATKEPYSGGAVDGQLLAARVLGTLAPGDYYNNLSATVPLRSPRPPRGTYFYVMVLEEQQDQGFVPIASASAGL